MAGKVTIGLASHWPCVTDNSGITTYGLMALEREMRTPPIPSRSTVHFTFFNLHHVTTDDHYLICYKLMKPERKFIIFLACNITNILTSKDSYNVLLNLMLTYFNLKFFTVAEMTYFCTLLVCL